ncbi:MAG: TonB-dependent receptor plug domain-containing protein [Limisphaerales bacterium]
MNHRFPMKSGHGLRLALAAGAVGQLLALPAALAQDAAAPQEPAAGIEELAPFRITGSLIPTTDLVGLTPVTEITSVDLVRRGVSTPAEVVRRLPAVVGANLSESYANGGDGSSQINLRGIPGGTLVLINGRRVAPVAFADSAVDLNMIPFAAIDRIEILKDGASAIYGSDAVAGVVNIILKENFEGVELGAYIGNTTETDALRQNYSFTAGTTTDKAGFTLSGNYYKQNALLSKDRERSRVNTSSRDADYINQVATSISNPGRFTVPNNFRGDNNLYNPNLPVAQNVPVSLNRGAVPDATGRYTPNDYHWSMAQIFDPSRVNEGTPDLEVYPFDKFPFPDYTPAIRPAERYSFFGSGHYKLFEEHVEFFADAFYSHSESESQLAPTPISNGSAGFPIPASNYYNPFGRNITSWAYRAVELGPRIDRIEKDAFRFVPGLRGKLPDTETWSWETAFLYSVERGDNYELGDINRTGLQQLAGLNTPDAFNPFGNVGSQAILNSVRRDLFTKGETELWSVDGRVGGDVFDLPAGGIGVVGGGSYQEDSGESIPDGNKQSGDLIGFLGADPLIGERSISSLFGEVKIPIFSDKYNVPGAYAINVRLQGRYDYYSDFGDTTNPGVKFGWQPFDEFFQVFGSWSTSFRAPTFDDLYTTAQESFPEVRNPFDDAFAQIETTQRGNPNLEPEEADNYTIGGEWRVKQVPGLKLGLTYFKIERENTPGGSAQFVIDQIAANVPNPQPDTYYFADGSSQAQTPSGAQNDQPWLKTDPSDGTVIETANVPTQNLSSDTIDGFDIAASYDWQTDSFGTFSFAMEWQYLLTYEQVQIPGGPAIDRLGDYSADEFGYESLPRLKGYGSFFWTYGDFSTGFYANYTDSYRDDWAAGFEREVDDYLTFDIQASYNFPYNIKLTVGCLNVTDEPPPLVEGSFADRYDRGLNDLRQRFWYVNFGVKF